MSGTKRTTYVGARWRPIFRGFHDKMFIIIVTLICLSLQDWTCGWGYLRLFNTSKSKLKRKKKKAHWSHWVRAPRPAHVGVGRQIGFWPFFNGARITHESMLPMEFLSPDSQIITSSCMYVPTFLFWKLLNGLFHTLIN